MVQQKERKGKEKEGADWFLLFIVFESEFEIPVPLPALLDHTKPTATLTLSFLVLLALSTTRHLVPYQIIPK
jgi:hypothetical protein